ncbi:hypothetical protein Patl1_07135 [Pistacia atlantica]|uniref:Uncharacterized protein n=1 Tax=Pistacia atlantica TaxID=434234 RepID=A0ACC1AIY2_9ROSI|nr:hypothetical protein Patl1_07135 [Pistacia atlantica]
MDGSPHLKDNHPLCNNYSTSPLLLLFFFFFFFFSII